MPAQGEKDYYAMSMLSDLLAEGSSSRLQKSIVDKQQKAVQTGSFPTSTEDPGLFITFAIANAGIDAADLERAMNDEIQKVKSTLINEKEFQKLKNKIENDFINSNAKMIGIAESLANYHVYYGNANLINTETDRYMNVTREDIHKAAKKYLTKSNRLVLYYLPKSSEEATN